MDFDQVMDALGMGYKGEIWREDWPCTEQTYAPEKAIFLEPGFVSDACDKMNLNDEVKQLFLKALPVFSDNLPLRRLFWHCREMFLNIAAGPREHCRHWYPIPAQPGGSADMFYPLIILSTIPDMVKFQAARGIPKAVTRETLAFLEPALLKPNAGARCAGMMWWYSFFFTSNIFRLGRLQFQMNALRIDFHVFRNRKDRKVIMLCGDQMKFRADGQFDGANDIFEKENTWVSEFKMGHDFIYGNPVLPQGIASKEKITLRTPEWDEIMKNNDLTLGIHIPSGGPMTHAECGEAFRQAIEFFPKHFPEFHYKSFRCESWLLDYQLEKYLPEESNIVKFLQEFYLFPVPWANDNGIFGFVFGKKFEEFKGIENVPQNTSLHRAIVAHMKSGGRWRTAGCLFFPEDFKWGGKVYRNELNYWKK